MITPPIKERIIPIQKSEFIKTILSSINFPLMREKIKEDINDATIIIAAITIDLIFFPNYVPLLYYYVLEKMLTSKGQRLFKLLFLHQMEFNIRLAL